MARIVWNRQLSTGERSIDLQHEELIDIINELDKAVAEGAPPAQCAVMQRLKQYVVFHFAHEESLMRHKNIDPTHMATHCKAHADFASQVAKAMDALQGNQAGRAVQCEALLGYLVNWLTEHIMLTDNTLARLLRNANLHRATASHSTRGRTTLPG